jgi:hypothetical protein
MAVAALKLTPKAACAPSHADHLRPTSLSPARNEADQQEEEEEQHGD